MGTIRRYGICHRLGQVFIAICLLLGSQFSTAETIAEQSMANRIVELIKSGEKTAAFELAVIQAREFEGLATFDYAYGLAAQAANHHHEAIFAFERVLSQYPNQVFTRYALGVSYFAVGNIIAAENEFLQLKALGQDKRFVHIPRYLEQIKKKKEIPFGLWSHSVQVGAGADSNANSGTDQETIVEFNLTEATEAVSDQYLSSQWQTSFIKPLNKTSSLYALGRVKYHSFIENSEMSRLYADVMAGYKLKLAGVNYHLSGYLRPMWLDGEKYLDYNGVMFDVSHQFNQGFTLGVTANLAALTFSNSLLDKSQTMFSLWYQQEYLGLVHKLSAGFGEESSDEQGERDLGRSFYSLSYQTSYNFTANDLLALKLDYTASMYNSSYLFKNQLTNGADSDIERQDNLLKLNLDYRKIFTPNWTWLVKLSFTTNSSSEHDEHNKYSYDRSLLWSAAQYKF